MSRKSRREAAKAAALEFVGQAKLSEPTSNPFPTGLQPAFSSSPARPPKFTFYCRYPHDARQGEGRLLVESFYGVYAAKRFLEHAMGQDEAKWPNLHTMVTSAGVEVKCMPPCSRLEENDIEVALNHKETREERFWILPDQIVMKWNRFTRPWPDVERLTPRAEAKVERSSRNARPDGDFVTVAQICDEVGCEPREGRAALRKKKIDKPPHGWAYQAGSPELEEIRSIIRRCAR